jgi:hypothetical protein
LTGEIVFVLEFRFPDISQPSAVQPVALFSPCE